MTKLLRHLFTGKDNQTYDLGRLLWALGVCAYIAYAGYAVWHAGQFAAQDYGVGLGSILAGGGAGLKFKQTTEPGGD